MTIYQRPADGPHDPGDAFVDGPGGARYWGRFGAAGLLAVDQDRGVLLQHRVAGSHFGGTWGLPGGARHLGENAREAALRESAEEAGVPGDAVVPRVTTVLDRGVWTYSTVVADVVVPFEAVIGDWESLELAWVPVERVTALPLHPGFAGSWPGLRGLLGVRAVVVAVRGPGAGGARSIDEGDPELAGRVSDQGVPGRALGLPGERWYPEVVEVAARGLPDRAVVEQAARLRAEGRAVTVMTAEELDSWARECDVLLRGTPDR